jgi:hypothetical protein
MAERVKGTLGDVTGYFYSYPDRHITIQEMEKHFKGKWDRRQILQACSQMVREGKVPLKRITSGVWCLNQKDDVAAALAPVAETTFTVTIIKETVENNLIVVSEAGDVYKMIHVA